MVTIEQKIAEFIKNPNLKCRSGVPFKVNSYQKDATGNVTALVGKVTEINQEGTAQEIDMLWNSNGNALCNKPMVYDLVEELPVDELGK